MPRDNAFADFMRRIRDRDEEAAAQLVAQYEPIIRREVRMRLTDPRLYRLFDSTDVCQSVLRSFFVRAAAGQYDLHQPDDLRKLLVAMAQNKVASRARKLRRQVPETHPAGAHPLHQMELLLDEHPGPEEVIAWRDLLGQVLHRLSEEERRLADLRVQGRSWPEIAAELGGTSEGRRKQLARALDRVLKQLGLEEEL